MQGCRLTYSSTLKYSKSTINAVTAITAVVVTVMPIGAMLITDMAATANDTAGVIGGPVIDAATTAVM
jgi:3D (Asp-Asp-Asp) domain-containing protein